MATRARERPRRTRLWGTDSGTGVVVVAVAARIVVLAATGQRFPPAADGVFYDRIAQRIAQGEGYTWVWPDGVVTYAAHYPVGYPAFLALGYAAWGASPLAGAVLNAILGVGMALAAHRLLVAVSSPRAAKAAGYAVALHPALLAYTPALMTEGVVTAWVTISLACAAAAARCASFVPVTFLMGTCLAAATLMRPQTLLLVPLFALLSLPWSEQLRPGWAGRGIRRVVLVTGLVLGLCLPWTVRNCVRMHRCALVSVNSGFNLLIGTDAEGQGAWAPVKVPSACAEVWDEASKDWCFEREAKRAIAGAPRQWLSLIPSKWARTFDYCGAAGYYLHVSNPKLFDESRKWALGAVETLAIRLTYLGALLGAALHRGPRPGARTVVAGLGAFFVFREHAYLAVLALLLAYALLGRTLRSAPTVVLGFLVVLLATLVTHAVFFGAGRYAMVLFPMLTCLTCDAVAVGLLRLRRFRLRAL